MSGGTVEATWRKGRKRCALCRQQVRREDASRDHRRPRGDGGYDRARNYQNAHRSCNSARGRLPMAEVERLLADFLAEHGRSPSQAEVIALLRPAANRWAKANPPTRVAPHIRRAIAARDWRQSRRAYRART